VADHLLERWVGEGVELHFNDGPDSTKGHADGGAGDTGFGQRGVEASVVTELLAQAFGNPKDPAQGTDY
jgi:hypothetical protein